MLQMPNLAQKQSCNKIGGSQCILNKTIEVSDLKRFHRHGKNVNRKQGKTGCRA